VGQEILDLAPTDPLRAFGHGYLAHLAADSVAHNFFVPRQLVLTSSTAALGHSYWESRFETHLGTAYPAEAKQLILQDHATSDAHLDAIIPPTLFSVHTSRRLFRGMVRLTESQSWQWAFQLMLENSRWDLPDADVERHMAVAFEYVMEALGDRDAAARRLDPAGHQALLLAKRMRRQALHEGAEHARVGHLHEAQCLGHVARVAAPLGHIAEDALRGLVGQGPAPHQPDELGERARRGAQLVVVGLGVRQHFTHDPVGRRLGVRA